GRSGGVLAVPCPPTRAGARRTAPRPRREDPMRPRSVWNRTNRGRRGSGRWRGWVLGALACAWTGTALAEDIGQQSFATLRSLGSTKLGGPAGPGVGTDTLADLQIRRPDLDALTADVEGNAGVTPLATPLMVPRVRNTPVTLLNRGFSGFPGLDHADQR